MFANLRDLQTIFTSFITIHILFIFFFFFFNDTATTEIYTLSLHDALPISRESSICRSSLSRLTKPLSWRRRIEDRKSTRLNSSHANISYAVFCLKKKKKGFLELGFVEFANDVKRFIPQDVLRASSACTGIR